MPSSAGSSRPKDRTCVFYVSCIGGVLCHSRHLGSLLTSAVLTSASVTGCTGQDVEVPTLHTLSKSHLKKRTGTWGPLLQWLHLDKCLLEQHMQGNYNGLKITTCVHSWD